MSLTCAECGTVNAADGTFCTGCGVSLAFAAPTGAASPIPRNAFPEEPGRVAGGSGTWLWVLGGALLLVAAVGGSGWWAFQRTASAPAEPVPTTQVESADIDPGPAVEASDTAMPADAALPGEELTLVEPPRSVVAPPVVAPPAAKAVQKPKPKPRAPARRAADDDDDDPAPRRSVARPVGPVGGGPASACYGRTGYLLDACISAQCRQPYYRNHPGCRAY